MCGITGLISKYPVNSTVLRQMTDSISHRGPDGEGFWFRKDQKIGFGHRRLSIIDLSNAGKQPMIDAESQNVITFNGEIYNYLEVKQELENLGVVFRTASDTEVILKAYCKWGKDCLQRFNGMFAFVIYDAKNQELFCARDRYGEKPFLFTVQPDFIAFASEYKALLQIAEIDDTIGELKMFKFAQNPSKGLDSDRTTVFKSILQLGFGEAMLINSNTLTYKIWKYWDVSPNRTFTKLQEPEVFSQFKALFCDAIKIRMRSDVTVGSCLSGGLDSSAIVSVVKKNIAPNSPYKTFTGIFPGSPANEWDYAKYVIEDSNVIPYTVEPISENLSNELPDFLWYNELPVSSTSQYAQWNVFRLAKQTGVTVLLDGQGADELLGGYEQYFKLYLKALKETGKYDRLERELLMLKKRYPTALLPEWKSKLSTLPFMVKYPTAQLLKRGSNFLFGLDFSLASQINDSFRLQREDRFNALSSGLYKDSFGGFLTTLLRYGDRNSMAHSREVRLPFCDHRLAEFVLSLPPEYLMGEIQTKRILRESMKGILPEKIRTRWNKQGFLPPQETWFKGSLLTHLEDLLNSKSFRENDLWNHSWWVSIMKRMKQGEHHLGWVIWKPFIIEAWKKYFLDSTRRLKKISMSNEIFIH